MKIDLTYDHLVTHLVPGPRSLSYFVPIFLLPIALLIPPSKASKQQLCAIFLPVITAAVIHSWNAMGGVDVISVDLLLWSWFMLVFKDPRRDFRRILFSQATKEVVDESPQTNEEAVNGTSDLKSNGHKAPKQTIRDSSSGYTEQAYPTNLRERLPWVGTLLISIRLSDWKLNSASHDSKQPSQSSHHSHSRFITIAILRFILGYLILDLTSAYTHHDPYFHTLGQPIDSPLPPHPFRLPIPPRLLRCSLLALQSWAAVSQQFHLPCILPAILHYYDLIPDTWSPHLWSPFFGSFTAIFTSPDLAALRIFWGSYWHQMLRNYCMGPGVWISEKLRLSRVVRYAVLTLSTFFLSGVVHMGLVPPEPLRATVSANTIRLLIAKFFWLQPLGFAIEALVSGLSRRAHLHPSVMVVLNVVWFVTWSCLVLPPIGEAGRQLGYWRVWPVPLSLWRGLRQGEWLVWG